LSFFVYQKQEGQYKKANISDKKTQIFCADFDVA
jgi:hypothetical protein